MESASEPELFESPDCDDVTPAQPVDVSRAGAAISVDVTDIVEHCLSARESFEVFMGRRYDPAEKSFEVDAVISQEPFLPSHDRFDVLARHLTRTIESGLGSGRGTSGTHKRLETPLQRYTRLLEEVSALQNELRVVEAADARRAPGTTAVDHASGVFKMLDGGAAVIQLQLSKLSTQVAEASSAAPLASRAGDAVAVAAPSSERAVLRQIRDQLAALHAAQVHLAAATQTVTAALGAMQHRLDGLLGTDSEE